MRILIYTSNYDPEPIGIAPLMTELAEGLVIRGHKVRVVTCMPNYPQRHIYDGYKGKLYLTEKRNGVIVQRSYVWVRHKPGLIDRVLSDGSFVLVSFLQALKGKRPDIIFLTVPPLPGSIAVAILSFVYKCPIILNVQDLLPDTAIQVGLLKNKVIIRLFKVLEKLAYRMSDAICIISEDFLHNLKSKGVPAHKIIYIPNWVDTNFICTLPKKESFFRNKYDLLEKFIVMYSGNIALTQGLQTAIEAAALLKHIKDIIFIIVGEENALAELKELCIEKELQNVLLLPFQPRDQLPDMLAAADVGLVFQKKNVISLNMPSKIPLLLASGRPIIASVPLSGATAQVISKSRGGINVFPESPAALAQAVQFLYQDSWQLMKLGERGRQYAIDNFSSEKIIDEYESLFINISQRKSESLVKDVYQAGGKSI